MKTMSLRVPLSLWCFIFAALVNAQEQSIEMLNEKNGQMMVFSEELVFLEVGQSLVWRATDKTHSVMFLKDGIPKGLKHFAPPLM